MATLIEGPPLATQIRAAVAEEVRELGGLGLVTLQIGEDPASTIYLRRKHEAAQGAGIQSEDRKLPSAISEDELLGVVAELNSDEAVDGILIQLPLPPHRDEALAIRAINPLKGVDGLHPFNAALLDLGRPTLVPATPLGIMALLAEHRIPVEGADAVVIGRSDIVGKPIAHLLLQANATVTICHSRTVDLERRTLEADVLVVAVGSPEFVTADMVKQGSVVVDVGINRTENGVVGDVASEAADVAAFMTPVPGGVGPMTIAMVLRNTVKAARYRRGLLAFPKG